MLNYYKITLKSGAVYGLTRDESEGKNLIGLWNWSLKRNDDIIVNFTDCSILLSEVAMINRPVPISDMLKGEDNGEEQEKDHRENVEEPGNLAKEPYDYHCGE